MPEKDQTVAERIRADVLAYVTNHPRASRGAVVRDVVGQATSVVATLAELAAEGLIHADGGGYVPVGWEPPRDLHDACRNCQPVHGGELWCGNDDPGLCWNAAWNQSGRPMPIPGWERAGRPSRDVWASDGGRFCYGQMYGDYWPVCDCGTGSGREDEMCARVDCAACLHVWPAANGWATIEMYTGHRLCLAVTSRNRLCRNRRGQCGAHRMSERKAER